ncbi:MAG: triose-phosphate isomerase [Clostridia bacterium]|jgi:triosephosphate isomerase|nr:triose-phosphate isomerase [Clostridia bacterium]
MRVPLIAGNWKMNKTPQEAVGLVNELKGYIQNTAAEVVVCPTFVALSDVLKAVEGSSIKVGAQNMYHQDSGAFTGEISPVFLKAMNIEYVILGHSERRQYFFESNEEINKKLVAAFNHNLKPILCVGETLEQREQGITFEVIKEQVEKCLANLQQFNLEELVVAYEPVWAIGTGRTATKEDANEVIGFIRQQLKEVLDEKLSLNIRILYGGSVKSSNIRELMNMPEIDGALVGGASLDAQEFSKIACY